MYRDQTERFRSRDRYHEECSEDSACADKVGYRSEAAAQRALAQVRAHKDEWASGKFPIRAYHCSSASGPCCWRWHLTSQPRGMDQPVVATPSPAIFARSSR